MITYHDKQLNKAVQLVYTLKIVYHTITELKVYASAYKLPKPGFRIYPIKRKAKQSTRKHFIFAYHVTLHDLSLFGYFPRKGTDIGTPRKGNDFVPEIGV